MTMRSRQEVDRVAETSASHYGESSASLRGDEGRAERGRGQLALVAEVSFDEVDASPKPAELETPLLLAVPGAGKHSVNGGHGVNTATKICSTYACARVGDGHGMEASVQRSIRGSSPNGTTLQAIGLRAYLLNYEVCNIACHQTLQ